MSHGERGCIEMKQNSKRELSAWISTNAKKGSQAKKEAYDE